MIVVRFALILCKCLLWKKQKNNLATFWKCTPPPQTNFEWQQSEKNSNITRKASSSGINIFNIIDILTLLSAAAKLAVLLRVPLLIKVEVSNFSLLHIPKWLCLVHHRQFAVSLQRVKRSVIYNFPCFSVWYSARVSFILSNTFSVTEILR